MIQTPIPSAAPMHSLTLMYLHATDQLVVESLMYGFMKLNYSGRGVCVFDLNLDYVLTKYSYSKIS